MALGLLGTRLDPGISGYALTQVQRSACSGDQSWIAAALPRFRSGKGCERLLLQRQLSAAQTAEQVLLIGGFGNDLRIWANGQLIREFDTRAGFDSTSQPLLIELQPGVLRTGSNEFLLQLRSGTGPYSRSYLGRVYLGPGEVLRPTFARAFLVGVQGAQLSIIVVMAILLTLLPIAWSRRQDPSYRWFVLALVGSSFYLWNMGWPLRLSPSMFWYYLAHSGLTVALWAMLRYTEALSPPSPGLRRRANALLACSMVMLTIKCFVNFQHVSMFADLGFRAALITALLLLARLSWLQAEQPLGRWLSAAALLCLLFGIADSARVWHLIGAERAPYLLHWGMLYLLALLLVGQVKRILSALTAAEQSQRQLGQALDQRSRELQQEFVLRQQAEQARTLAEERQRIMRDMHDGVGGQLVALIGQAENGKLDAPALKQQLRRSLDDLRLMIDSLDDACADLGVALGMLRQRLQSSLKGLPMQISWSTAQLPDLAPRAPDEVLQVLRIVQEAITNALKHARCEHLTISASWEAGWLEITVQDDGVGLGGGSGRGLPSMRQRAASIGASIDIADQSPGTRVRLRLPQALAAGNRA
jgi:signal transduction histidine kinase